MGATSGLVEGRGLVCGGAVEEYVQCVKERIGELWDEGDHGGNF